LYLGDSGRDNARVRPQARCGVVETPHPALPMSEGCLLGNVKSSGYQGLLGGGWYTLSASPAVKERRRA